MNNNKDALLSFLGLCRRAGKMTLGCDMVTESVASGETRLILMASDISTHTENDVKAAAEGKNVKIIKILQNKEQLSMALGKTTAVLSVNDNGFAKKTVTIIETQNS